MAFKMQLLALSILLIVKVTMGEIDCGDAPINICVRPERMKVIPRDVSGFNDYCEDMKAHLKCLKEWQDGCGSDRVVFFETNEIFEAHYRTLSEVCEEGTLLNTVAIENLKCFNETFGRTRCDEEAEEFIEPLLKQVNEEEEIELKISIFCLRSTFVSDCALRAISANCGRLVEEAALEVLYRSKILENSCQEVDEAQDLETLDKLDLAADMRRSMARVLQKLTEEKNE